MGTSCAARLDEERVDARVSKDASCMAPSSRKHPGPRPARRGVRSTERRRSAQLEFLAERGLGRRLAGHRIERVERPAALALVGPAVAALAEALAPVEAVAAGRAQLEAA